MPINKKQSVFFAGGKKVELENNTTTAKGMKLIRNEDKSWNLSLELLISAEEAAHVVSKFSDFTKPDGTPITDTDEDEKLFPNQVYLEAFNLAGDPIDITFDRVKLLVSQDKEDGDEGSGDIVITLSPTGGVGKTQNIKTQNAAIGH